jgi:hypothetical protein
MPLPPPASALGHGNPLFVRFIRLLDCGADLALDRDDFLMRLNGLAELGPLQLGLIDFVADPNQRVANDIGHDLFLSSPSRLRTLPANRPVR